MRSSYVKSWCKEKIFFFDDDERGRGEIGKTDTEEAEEKRKIDNEKDKESKGESHKRYEERRTWHRRQTKINI